VIITRRMRWASNVERRGKMRNAQKTMVGIPKGSPKCRWEYNIKLDIRERG